MSKSDSITGICDIPLPKSAHKQPIEPKSAHKQPIELKSAPKQPMELKSAHKQPIEPKSAHKQPIELKSAHMQPIVKENQDKQEEEEWCEVRLRYYRLLDSLVVECWLRVREVPGSIPSQGPRHTKDVIKMVPVVPLFSTEHVKGKILALSQELR